MQRRLWEAGGRDGRAAVTAREARSHQKLKEAKEEPPSPLESVEGAQPCLDLSLDFWLQNWEKVNFCYVKLSGNEGTVLSFFNNTVSQSYKISSEELSFL